MVDVLAQESNGSINKEEMGATDVPRTESPTDIPVVPVFAGRDTDLTRCRPTAGREVVDGHNGGRMEIAHSILMPHAAGAMVVTGGQYFTHVNCVGSAIRYVADADGWPIPAAHA